MAVGVDDETGEVWSIPEVVRGTAAASPTRYHFRHEGPNMPDCCVEIVLILGDDPPMPLTMGDRDAVMCGRARPCPEHDDAAG